MFFIKRKKLLRNGEAPIFVRIRVGNQNVDLSILKSVNPDIWIADKGHASGNSKEAREVNVCIDKTRFNLMEHAKELLIKDEEFTANSIRDSFLGKETKKFLLATFSEHNENIRQLIGKDYTYTTLKRYRSGFGHAQAFIKAKYKKEDILLTDVDHEFITKFELYLKTEIDCAHNTTTKYLQNLKKIIRIALANGWITQDPYAKVKLSMRKVDKGFLTEEELKAIIKKDFRIERLEHVKDTFLFACFTGLAYCDLKNLTPENLISTDGKMWIHTKRMKTDNQSHIPLLPPAAEIVEKYKTHPYCVRQNVLLPVYSNQRLNGYLKEIADICGINKTLTTHIARHTFATTVTLNNDIPIETVSKMLGHSSIKMTQTYARLLDKKVGQDMEKLHVKYAGMV
jgi:integrase